MNRVVSKPTRAAGTSVYFDGEEYDRSILRERKSPKQSVRGDLYSTANLATCDRISFEASCNLMLCQSNYDYFHVQACRL